MPTFAYTARDASGQSVSGTLAAASIADVGRMLRQEGKLPIHVQPSSNAITTSNRGGIKVSRKEVIQLSTQLAIMVETGVTIVDALECIGQQANRPRLRELLKDLSSQVQSGGDFSSALAKHPRSFPILYVALIKASEKSGMLAKMLNRATEYIRDEADIVRKVKGALTYPAIMCTFACTTTIFLLIFVLPRFTALYASKAAALPLPTQILMAISDVLLNWWMVLLPSLAIVVGATWWATKFTQIGKRALHTVQLYAPLLGGMFRQMHLARSLRMIGTMASSGVHLVDCVTTARDLCENVHFQNLWNKVEQQLHVGKQFSEPLFESNLCPKPIAQMISSAEKSGKLATVMEQVAGFSEQELKEKISEMTRYIEPAMIVIMGVVIGGVTMALLLPVFTISRVMSH